MTCAIRTILFAAGLASTDAAAGQIELTMTGFASDDGQARIVLVEGIEGYTSAKPVTLTASVPIENHEARWSATVEPGTYAVIAHHDRNANDELDRPVFQLPLEPYGYSNGAWTSLGLPAFDEVAFAVGDGASPQRIAMRTNAFVSLAQAAAIGAAALAALFVLAAFRRRRAVRTTQEGNASMNISALTRAGAAGMIVSGLALGYSYVTHPHQMSPETIAAPSWVLIHALFAMSLVLGLLGTTALYAPTAARAGRWGLAGFVSLFIGMMLIFGLDYYEVLIAPYLAVHYPEVVADHGAGDAMGPVAVFFPLAGALTVIGYAALAYGWMKGKVLPRPVAVAMIVSALAFGFGLSPLGGLFAARVTAAAFGAALIAIGVSAWRSAATAPATA